MSFRHRARRAADRLFGTPFDRALQTAQRRGCHEFVFGWNRGLGDIALGLTPLFARIRAGDARSRIVVFTRPELVEAFALTEADQVHGVVGLERGAPVDPLAAAAGAGVVLHPSAAVFANPDPTRWLRGQTQAFGPRLRWNAAWNARADRLLPAGGEPITIGAHVSSETAQFYRYVKDWPADRWRTLFARFPAARGVRWLLFGHAAATEEFRQPNVVDLRARTGLIDLLATIRTRCHVLIAPDSGILTTVYYLADAFPLEVVSLWSDPRQGILRQGLPSPNPQLHHVPLFGPTEDVRNLTVDDVAVAVEHGLSRSMPATLAPLPHRAPHVASPG